MLFPKKKRVKSNLETQCKKHEFCFWAGLVGELASCLPPQTPTRPTRPRHAYEPQTRPLPRRRARRLVVLGDSSRRVVLVGAELRAVVASSGAHAATAPPSAEATLRGTRGCGHNGQRRHAGGRHVSPSHARNALSRVLTYSRAVLTRKSPALFVSMTQVHEQGVRGRRGGVPRERVSLLGAFVVVVGAQFPFCFHLYALMDGPPSNTPRNAALARRDVKSVSDITPDSLIAARMVNPQPGE
jgi:hypothetical protein